MLRNLKLPYLLAFSGAILANTTSPNINIQLAMSFLGGIGIGLGLLEAYKAGKNSK